MRVARLGIWQISLGKLLSWLSATLSTCRAPKAAVCRPPPFTRCRVGERVGRTCAGAPPPASATVACGTVARTEVGGQRRELVVAEVERVALAQRADALGHDGPSAAREVDLGLARDGADLL